MKLEKPKPKRAPASRWTPDIAKDGWTPVAISFLDNYSELVPEITSLEAMLIVHLIRHKWDQGPCYPGFETLAKRMGLTPTAVRNHARKLEKKGYLRRQPRVSKTNLFYLDGLFKKLEEHLKAKPPKLKKEALPEIDMSAFL